jgi:Cys-rich protein (TIGR01571 family)
MLSFILPCYVFGLVAENTGKNCLGYSVLSLIPFANWYFCTKVRTDLRTQKKIDGTILNDFLVQNFCTPCAITQEAQVRDHYK